jgi:hypothetical protein
VSALTPICWRNAECSYRVCSSVAADGDGVNFEEHGGQGEGGHAGQGLRRRARAPDPGDPVGHYLELGIVSDDVSAELDDVLVVESGGGQCGVQVVQRPVDLLSEVRRGDAAVAVGCVLAGDENVEGLGLAAEPSLPMRPS